MAIQAQVTTISGAEALALGAVEAGVSLVTGYPGSPATAVFNHILKRTQPGEVRLEWCSNEKVAIEMAFGAALAGQRSLLCVKSVGLNVALDPLMVYDLAGCPAAGLVVFVGDDPEGWGSQNEQDSRTLAIMSELPLLEPATVAAARVAMLDAFRLSEEEHLPVIVRATRALVEAKETMAAVSLSLPPPQLSAARPRSIVLPIDVVSLHQALLDTLESVRAGFEVSSLNHVAGEGRLGIIAAGFAYQRLLDALRGHMPPGLRILALGTPYPLPVRLVSGFLQDLDAVLVLEETDPMVEQAVRAAVQQAGLGLPVYGRATGHLPGAGELRPSHLLAALRAFMPAVSLPEAADQRKAMPSRVPLCDGCPYTPTFAALNDVMQEIGGRDRFIVTGETGCMVRSQISMPDLLDVKHGLGSGIAMAAGLAIAQHERRVVALSGDSSFLHTGLFGLVDACRMSIDLLVVILDNGTVALTGGQPHAGTPHGARGEPRPAVDLVALSLAAGAHTAQMVDVNDGELLHAAMRRGLEEGGVNVVVAHGACPEESHKE